MKKENSFWLWLLALLLTLLVSVYQRVSGPTYPLRGTQRIAGVDIQYELARSGISDRPLVLRFDVRATGQRTNIQRFNVHHRRFPFIASEDWAVEPMVVKDDAFEAEIPGQPAAGKVAYKIEVFTAGGSGFLNNGKPVVARFKGEVPAWLLILHILCMFAGLLLAFRTGLGAIFNDGSWQRLISWTLGVTSAGGLLLGPVVQKYAFGAFWTGFPLGSDLTDSKTLFAVLAWLGAFLLRKKSRWWFVAATVMMVGVYLIPHSVLGSELNYQTGKIETAKDVRR